MRSRVLLLVAATSVLIMTGVWSTISAQDRDKAFSDGMKGYKDRQYEAAASKMREAIASDSRESTRRVGSTLGLGGDQYLPHFVLGRALLALERCPAALDAWEESEKQGVVRQDRDRSKVLDDAYAACEQRGFLPAARLRAEAGPVEQALSRAQEAYQDVVGFARTSSYALPAPFTAHGVALRDAEAKLKGVESSHSRQTLQDVTASANRVAADSREMLTTVKRAVSERDLVGDASKAIQVADRAGRDLETTLAAARARPPLTAAMTAVRQRAVQDLQDAKSALSSGELGRARDLASGAKAAFDKVAAGLALLVEGSRRADLAAADRKAKQSAAAIESKIAELRTALAAQALPADILRQGLDGLDQVHRQSVARLQRLATVVRAGDLAGVGAVTSELATVRGELGEIEARLVRSGLRPSGLVVPDALKAGAGHFFAAEYKDVLGALTPDIVESMPPQLKVHGHLFRAAALFALFEDSGRTDASLVSSARQVVEACRQIDPLFQPDPAAFSPRFIAFFGQFVPSQ